MNIGTFIKLDRDHKVSGRENRCLLCSSFKKACYRYNVRGYGMVYVIMPCHECQPREFRHHELHNGYMEVSNEWRNQNAIAKRLLENENAAPPPAVLTAGEIRRIRESALSRMAELTQMYSNPVMLQPQRAPDPVQSDIEDSVDDER